MEVTYIMQKHIISLLETTTIDVYIKKRKHSSYISNKSTVKTQDATSHRIIRKTKHKNRDVDDDKNMYVNGWLYVSVIALNIIFM